MTQTWTETKRIFGDALALPPPNREAFVRRTCAENEAVRDEVLQLLRHHGAVGDFLDPPSVSRLLQQGSPHRAGAPDAEGGILAKRYLLKSRLGHGGGGAVYEADDLLRGSTVAVKVLYGIGDSTLTTIRREVAMLRFLRLPGVVQLLDDGQEGDFGFIVMEMVQGTPFPGPARSRHWDDLRGPLLALIETLARIHWAGVIHCDLKPANVLVDDSHVPTVLDLGLSAWQEADVRSAEPDLIFGTFRYLAPERLRGAPPSVPSDLFSLGVMVYEALSGGMPYDHQRRKSGDVPFAFPTPAKLGEVAPDVPTHVAALVDRLVAADPELRPASATEAHAILRGVASRRLPSERRLPRFTGSSVVDAALAAARAGRSIDISGPAGSGRKRTLEDVGSALESEGRRVIRLRPSESPLGSMAELLEGIDDSGLRLEEMQGIARRRTKEALRADAIILADDAARLDRWSAEILACSRDAGAVLRVVSEPSDSALPLVAATEEELRGLFEGPDRLHHLREDAAAELWRRTFGLPAAVAAELEAWVRAGIARWEDDKIVVTRAKIERLRAGFRAMPPLPLGEPDPTLPETLHDLLACIDLAGDSATPDLLAAATGRSRWVIEAQLEELERRRAIRRENERFRLLIPTHVGHGWQEERRLRVHEAIAAACAEGSESRLFHLLACNRIDAVVREAPLVSDALLREGKVDRALSVLDEGLAAVRRIGSRGAERTFLVLMLRAALASATSASLDLLLYSLARSHEEFADRRALETIARGALAALQGAAERALADLEDVGPPTDPELARCLWAVRVLASSQCDLDRHDQVVQQATAWASSRTEPDVCSAACDWLGWLRYRQGRYSDAVELHARAAALAESVDRSAVGFLNAAWAALEAGLHSEVERLAKRAQALAAGVRHAHLEARAELMLRSAAYRRGDEIEPDHALVRAVGGLGLDRLHGLVALNEAAVAWRAQRPDEARGLANEASLALRRAGQGSGGLLADVLGLACGASSATDTVALAEAGARCPLPGVAVQILALVHRARRLPASWRERGCEIAETIPAEARSLRREVLSIEEALGWLQTNE